MKVRHQMLAGFGAVIGLFLVSLVVVGFFLSGLVGNIRHIDQTTLPDLLVVDEMDLARSEVQQFLTDVSATRDDGGYKEADDAAKVFLDGVQHFRARLEAEGDREGLRELQAIEQQFQSFHAVGRKMAEAYIRDGVEAGNEWMKGTDQMVGFDTVSEQLKSRLDVFRARKIDDAKGLTASTFVSANQIVGVMVAGALVAAVLGVLLGYYIASGIVGQLGAEPAEAAAFARQVGGGDFTATVRMVPHDRSSLMANLIQMRDELSKVVTEVRHCSNGVAAAAEQIASGNRDLAQRTAGQASSLEQVSASMLQMRDVVDQNAESGQDANRLAQAASQVAQRGGAVVADVVTTMSGINEASRKIEDIIGVIDGIAFQTNILALNAAVEAARAGEAGRGFAVVAGEVRSLAGRTTEAAKEIKTLISASVAQIDRGGALVGSAGSTMSEVVDSIQQVTGIVSKISDASHQQAQGVEQVGQTVRQLDEATQQNATLVEEMDSAAAALNTQARDLVRAVNVFKVLA